MYSGKKIRMANEDLQDLLKGLKVGDGPVYDSLTNYEITRVPNGFVYRHEYEGIVFVPDVVEGIKGSQAKTEPKKMVTK